MSIEMSRRTRCVLYIFTALAFVMCATLPASANWRAVDAQNAWNGYVTAFVHLEPDGYSKVFVTQQGGTTPEDFWRQAEEIEVAEDAYNENPTTANKDLIQALCDGFVNYVHPATNDDWSSDHFNDDLNVAIIAFARAYLITGTTRWKSAAQNNYATVWNRAQAGDGGLCEQTVVPVNCYENSSVNWTFVIAANLLNQIAPVGTGYKSQGDGVYTWAKANLYIASSGGIADGKGQGPSNYTYNYGYAMIAGSYQGSNVMVPNIANYVFNNLNNYEEPVGGINIMPDYGQGNVNNGGFNGILMRGVGFANGYGYIPSAVLAAAQANMNQAWSERNGTNTLVWNDWDAATPATGNYSWDDSAALAGLLDIPPTA